MITKDNTVKASIYEETTHIIKIKDYYPDDCSGQEFMEVSHELFVFLENEKRKKESEERKERRYFVPFGFDEEGAAEVNGIVSDSAEAEYFSKKDWEQIRDVERIISKLTPIQRNRLYLRIVRRLSFKEISKIEEVGITSVEDSYQQSLARLRRYRHILQRITLKDWTDLLI